MEILSDNKDIDDIITGYLTQNLTKAEILELKNWIDASIENKNHFLQMQEVWFSSVGAKETPQFDKELAFQRFMSRVAIAKQEEELSAVKEEVVEDEVEHKSVRSLRFYFPRVAAAVAALLLVAGSGFWFGKNQDSKLMADVVVEAPKGSTSSLYLPDGSVVWLKPSSKIIYSQDFGRKSRNVKLEGEAFFEVEKNEKVPFEVASGNLSVTVLGTKFNFRNYSDENISKVTLLEGKVSFDNTDDAGESVILTPNQQIEFDKIQNKSNVSEINPSDVSLWQTGRVLNFDETKLSEIAKQLEKCYDVQISIENESLKDLQFFGNFSCPEQSITEVMDVLASTRKFTYQVKGSAITIYSK